MEELPAFLQTMHGLELDLAIQLHGNGIISNPLVALFGARENAGFCTRGAYYPNPERFLPWPESGSEIRRLLALLEFLGLRARGEELEFPVWRDDEAEADALGIGGEYACVHPGARLESRRWPPERFAAVGDGLAREGLGVVLTGSDAEADVTEAVAARMEVPATDVAGKTTLGGLAALLSRARLLVSNDTGVSHLAAALRVPSVVVVTTSDPDRWAPLDRDRHRVVFLPDRPEDVLAEVSAAVSSPTRPG